MPCLDDGNSPSAAPPLCPSPLESSSMWKASGSCGAQHRKPELANVIIVPALVRRPAAGAPASVRICPMPLSSLLLSCFHYP